MTRKEVAKVVNTISTVLNVEQPRIKYAKSHKGVFLEAGLYQGWELVVFNPEFLQTANDISVCLAITHEVRHIYQMCEVRKRLENLPHVNEAEKWHEDIRNGKNDTIKDSKEIDADIFAHTFVSGVFDVGFDVVKMTDVETMRTVFNNLKQESWYNKNFDKVIFYEKEKAVYIGCEDLLEKEME